MMYFLVYGRLQISQVSFYLTWKKSLGGISKSYFQITVFLILQAELFHK